MLFGIFCKSEGSKRRCSLAINVGILRIHWFKEKDAAAEHLQEEEVLGAGVFNIVSGSRRHIAHIIGNEAYGASFCTGFEDRHAS